MLARLLDGTPLAGSEVLAVERAPEVLVVVPTRELPVLEAWRLLRDLVDQTGRWPVAITDDGVVDEWLRYTALTELDVPASAWPWNTYVDDSPLLADQLTLQPPLDELVRQDLTFPTTRPTVDRWTYERLLDDPGLRGPWTGSSRWVSTENWFRPQRVAYALLPTTSSWQAQGWLRYFGALGLESGRKLLAAEREWHERWGAELVASWGTILQFVVSRRPTDPEDCWEVAGQLKAVGGSLQMDRHDLALSLPHGNAWFLHDRP